MQLTDGKIQGNLVFVLKIFLKTILFFRIKTEKSEYSVTVLPSMPQLGVKIKRLNVAEDENDARNVTNDDEKSDVTDAKSNKSEDEEIYRLHDGETTSFYISLTNVSNR